MNFRNALITALRAISKNKMRAALTSIGIIIGVSSVIVMVGMGNSARVAVRQKVYSYGSSGMRVQSGRKLFQTTDIENLKKNYPEIQYITPIYDTKKSNIQFKNKKIVTELFGVNNDFLKIKNRNVISGRVFTRMDIIATNKVAIIGNTVKQKFFPNSNPIGKQIVVHNIPVKIVGLLEKAGEELTGRDFDNWILIPYTTANSRIWKMNGFRKMFVSADSEKNVTVVYNIIKRYFRRSKKERHHDSISY